MACGILVPWPGIKPTFPALEGRFLNIGPLGSTNRPFQRVLGWRDREVFWQVWHLRHEWASKQRDRAQARVRSAVPAKEVESIMQGYSSLHALCLASSTPHIAPGALRPSLLVVVGRRQVLGPEAGASLVRAVRNQNSQGLPRPKAEFVFEQDTCIISLHPESPRSTGPAAQGYYPHPTPPPRLVFLGHGLAFLPSVLMLHPSYPAFMHSANKQVENNV